ncbi:hypothetical protein [Lacinutrix sp. Bg11-31]|uniref:hypothetical protein n=1 Tax=Lacinutrix sp. Bg11-31 TaxID=2057808 RepID=UPI0012FD2840|nr:hypothetical protein [Lacinutrix sp. Bg11-31]
MKEIIRVSVDKNTTDTRPILHDISGNAKISNVDFNKQFGFYSTDLTVEEKR